LIKEPLIAPKSLNRIKNPVLVIAGEKDVIKQEHTELIAKEIPKSKLLIFEKDTHFIPFESPEKLDKAIIEFLQNP